MTKKTKKEQDFMRMKFATPMPVEYYQASVAPDHLWGWIMEPPESVLEIGCGDARLTYWLRMKGMAVVATDIVTTWAHPMLCVQEMDKEKLTFEDDMFDLVVCSNVLHHGDLDATLREVYRVLRSGGQFISLQEPAIGEDEDEDEYLQKHCKQELDDGIDERRPSLLKYATALEWARLTDPSFCYCNDPKYEIEADKFHLEAPGGVLITAFK